MWRWAGFHCEFNSNGTQCKSPFYLIFRMLFVLDLCPLRWYTLSQWPYVSKGYLWPSELPCASWTLSQMICLQRMLWRPFPSLKSLGENLVGVMRASGKLLNTLTHFQKTFKGIFNTGSCFYPDGSWCGTPNLSSYSSIQWLKQPQKMDTSIYLICEAISSLHIF